MWYLVRHKIGEFSKMAKVTIKTLRHYDEMDLLKPASVDRWNGYRYYSSEQLNDICKIKAYREVGLSLEEIADIFAGEDPKAIMESKRSELEIRISSIDRLIENSDTMDKYSIEMKVLPECIVAFRHGKIDKYEDMTEFVMGFASMCAASNPDVECTDDDYCFVEYSDPDYRESDIELTYAQAVKKEGKTTDDIGFRHLNSIKAICVKHYGPYKNLGSAYAFITAKMSEMGFEIAGSPRECYINGCWNCESEDDYLTEIQIPIRN